MKTMLSADELICHMKKRGVKFNIISETEAKEFLQSNNYYMKLASYRTNYQKYTDGKNKGKYINLECAYLKELSTIDMRLRYIVMEMCLDLEHYLKVALMKDIESNPEEDGYDIIRRFLGDEKNIYILKKIKGHNSSEYCKRLIEKYYPYFPAWVFIELISFGDLTYLCAFYEKIYGTQIVNNKFLNIVRDIRNASAHSNCMINRLFDPRSGQADAAIVAFVSKCPEISRTARNKNLKYRVVYDFVTLLYVYDTIVPEKSAKSHRYEQLKKLFDERMVRNREYFSGYSKLVGVYRFAKKLVDSL